MKNIFLLVMFLLSVSLNAQEEKTNFTLKKKFFYGAEIGSNTMNDYYFDQSKTSVQGGIFVEYYFAKKWSVMTKLKYYETGVAFYAPSTHSGSWFDLGSDAYYGSFRGNVISVPIFLKFEFILKKN